MDKRVVQELRAIGLTDYFFQQRQQGLEAVAEMLKRPKTSEEMIDQIRRHHRSSG